jgi:superfamily II DNA or RNA helicase
MDPTLIRRSGNLLEFKGVHLLGPPYQISETLSYWHRTWFKGEELRARYAYAETLPAGDRFRADMECSRRSLYSVDGQSVLCGAGLLKRLTDALTVNGIPHTFQDLRENKLQPAQFERLLNIPGLQFRHGQMEALAAIEDFLGGIIDCSTAFGKTFLICLLTAIYPQAKIMVISPGKDLIKSTYQRLLGFTHDVGRVGAGFEEPDKRVTLCSADSLHKARLGQQHLVLYDEVHTAGTDRRINALAGIYTDAKMIGLSASFNMRGDGADRMIESIFGPVILKINYDESAEAGAITPIRVMMEDVPPIEGYIPCSDKAVLPSKKRRAYWRNALRNDIIAEKVAQIPKIMEDADPQILIMVDTLDHAFELKRRLPEFELVYGDQDQSRIDDLSGQDELTRSGHALTSKERDQLRVAFEQGTLRRAIATGVWKQGVDFCGLSALIRADGGNSKINDRQIPGRLSRLFDGKKFGLLIDFYDHFDPWAANRSASRLREYQKLKWQILEASGPSVRCLVPTRPRQ